jgi:hypothetical protein
MMHFLSTRDLWPHFRSDDALRQFWSSTTAERRRELWGEPFDVGELRRRFDKELVSDAYLGRTLGGVPLQPQRMSYIAGHDFG